MSDRPFTIVPVIDGYEVVAADTGRQVAHRATARSANGVAYMLNGAASNPSDPNGPPRRSGLARAFRMLAARERPQHPQDSDTELSH